MAAPAQRRDGKPTLNEPLRPDEELHVDVDHNGRTFTSVERVRGAEDQQVQDAHVPAMSRPEARRRILTQKALIMLSEGERMIDIAEMLGVTVGAITGWIARHKQKVRIADIDLRLDQIALPIATDNLIHGLLAGDKDYTLETLKGRGAFRRHSDANITLPETLPDLVVRFEAPPAAAGFGPHDIAMGRVVGKAALPAPATDGEKTDQQVLDAVYEVQQVHGKGQVPEGDE